jgi:hypothetical protein
MVVGITAFSIGIQQRCPPAMRGRVMALWVIAFSGVRPVAGPILGFTSDHFSTMTAMTATGLFMLLATFVVYVGARRKFATSLAQVAPEPARRDTVVL